MNAKQMKETLFCADELNLLNYERCSNNGREFECAQDKYLGTLEYSVNELYRLLAALEPAWSRTQISISPGSPKLYQKSFAYLNACIFL